MRPYPRRLFIALAGLALIGPSAAHAQDWVSQVFPERQFDFGTVAKGSKVRHAFKIVNTTDQDIRILTWKPKCGCTSVTVGAKEIPPGTQTVIEAVIDTTNFNGPKPSGLVLVLDKPTFQEVDLNLSCFIRSDIVLNPGVVDFGTLNRGATPKLELTLTYAGGQAEWGIEKSSHQSPHLTARLDVVEGSRTGGQVQYKLTAGLLNTAPTGFFKDEIVLRTNDPNAPTIPVSVAANIQANVVVSPSVVNLGRMKAGSQVTKVFLVRSAKPFKITKSQSTRPELTIDGAVADSRPLHSIKVTFTAPSQPGPYNGAVEIQTDQKDEPPAKLTAFATIVP